MSTPIVHNCKNFINKDFILQIVEDTHPLREMKD
jgi:hypothetical protein